VALRSPENICASIHQFVRKAIVQRDSNSLSTTFHVSHIIGGHIGRRQKRTSGVFLALEKGATHVFRRSYRSNAG
jgi:hypothetical protein